MLVHIEKLAGIPQLPHPVRVQTPYGSGVVRWRGDPGDPEGWYHVEWTVDEDIVWGGNTQWAATAGSAIGQEDSRVVLRGRLTFVDTGGVLKLGESQILFDVAEPPPGDVDGTWVEIRCDGQKVTLWPYRI
ncbi:hypothetical protein [Streptantibioticus ferralitis]|uniref:Uncharacterized protein n=1 Tax=Streptantibioticus ferralitis TaxID=236510 RepID=A0ABT5ZAZ5_9ACTN|nr:hypothetical protein [Streptantibioticus ferralitis]MDF2260220.1 hypothetical protein [Streptantibioticus ferralitis]